MSAWIIAGAGPAIGGAAYRKMEAKELEKYWAQTSSVRPTSIEQWARREYNFPIRLKYQNPTTIPRRWQTPMR